MEEGGETKNKYIFGVDPTLEKEGFQFQTCCLHHNK